ncbi:MAG: hypothetical protein M1830_003886, partial [Pleopsidium flavum]
MHALVWHVLRSSPKCLLPRSCRFIAGRRYPLTTRNFHRSAVAYRNPDDPVGTPDPTCVPTVDVPASTSEESESASEVDEGEEPADTSTEKLHTAKDKSNYGSATRRAGRNVQKPKAPPPVSIPEWFLERNVLLREDLRVKLGLLDRLTPGRQVSTFSKRVGDVESHDGTKVGEKPS